MPAPAAPKPKAAMSFSQGARGREWLWRVNLSRWSSRVLVGAGTGDGAGGGAGTRSCHRPRHCSQLEVTLAAFHPTTAAVTDLASATTLTVVSAPGERWILPLQLLEPGAAWHVMAHDIEQRHAESDEQPEHVDGSAESCSGGRAHASGWDDVRTLTPPTFPHLHARTQRARTHATARSDAVTDSHRPNKLIHNKANVTNTSCIACWASVYVLRLYLCVSGYGAAQCGACACACAWRGVV